MNNKQQVLLRVEHLLNVYNNRILGGKKMPEYENPEPDLEETIKKIYRYKNEVPHKNWSKYLFATAIGIGYNMS